MNIKEEESKTHLRISDYFSYFKQKQYQREKVEANPIMNVKKCFQMIIILFYSFKCKAYIVRYDVEVEILYHTGKNQKS